MSLKANVTRRLWRGSDERRLYLLCPLYKYIKTFPLIIKDWKSINIFADNFTTYSTTYSLLAYVLYILADFFLYVSIHLLWDGKIQSEKSKSYICTVVQKNDIESGEIQAVLNPALGNLILLRVLEYSLLPPTATRVLFCLIYWV
jgi:hypothetical protein